jgi:hypothetical protein
MYVFIRLVFSLPSVVLVPLLRDWLEFEDITAMDTSICNHSDRADYLKVISRDILNPYLTVVKKRRLFDWYCESDLEENPGGTTAIHDKHHHLHWNDDMVSTPNNSKYSYEVYFFFTGCQVDRRS